MKEDDLRPSEGESDGCEEHRRLLADYEARLQRAAELAARVRHEVNNPLTGLLGQTQLLLRENLSETAHQRVTTIEQLALRIRDTIAQLREVRPPGQNPSDARDERRKEASRR